MNQTIFISLMSIGLLFCLYIPASATIVEQIAVRVDNNIITPQKIINEINEDVANKILEGNARRFFKEYMCR